MLRYLGQPRRNHLSRPRHSRFAWHVKGVALCTAPSNAKDLNSLWAAHGQQGSPG